MKLSLQRAVPCAVGTVTAAVILLSITPLAALWVVTSTDLSNAASKAIDDLTDVYRTATTSRAALNVSATLVQPSVVASALRVQLPLEMMEGSASEYLDVLHRFLVPLRINNPYLCSISVAWTNARGSHMFMQTGCAVSRADPAYCVLDTEQSADLVCYRYVRQSVATSAVVRTVANYSVPTATWWTNALGDNAVQGAAWLGPMASGDGDEGAVLWYTEQLKHPDPNYDAVVWCALSARSFGAFFASGALRPSDIAVLATDERVLVAGTAGVATASGATGAPLAMSGCPNETVRDIEAAWTALCGGAMCEREFDMSGGAHVEIVDAAVVGGASWWLVVAYLPDAVQRDIDRASSSTTVAVIAVLCETVVMSFVAVVLATLFGLGIVRPLALVSQQMHHVSLLDFARIDGTAFSTPRRSSISEVNILEKEAERMSETLAAFSKYVPIAVVKSLIKKKLRPSVGVREMQATILFLDVANFTTTMDSHGADTLICILEEMFDTMSNILEENGAIIDKYIGDSIMALWGCPEAVEKSELRSCKAVLEIHSALAQMNSRFAKSYGIEMGIRVGWHSGPVYAGNVGSSNRLNYTVLGNSVNLASRLESLNKEMGTHYCVTDSIRDKCSVRYAFRCLGSIRIRGFASAVTVHEFLGETSQLTPENEAVFANFRDLSEKLHSGRCTVEELKAYSIDHPEDIVVPYIIARLTNAN
eukprot:m51a1_g6312 hypothetical protein (706) ;mRNA; f:329390-332096